MFSDNETKLLHAPADAFPLLKAVQRTVALYGCPVCGQSRVNPHAMLRLAVNKYKSDKNFIDLCRSLFALPCTVAGVHLP